MRGVAGDEKKTELLRGLPGAAERLVLFEADIYDAASFEPAIQGCEFGFLVATPLQHNSGSSKVNQSLVVSAGLCISHEDNRGCSCFYQKKKDRLFSGIWFFFFLQSVNAN